VAARADHQHSVKTAPPVALADEAAEGSSSALARADHVHSHGEIAGGKSHALANRKGAGFMSAAEHTKLACLGYQNFYPSPGGGPAGPASFAIDPAISANTHHFGDGERQGVGFVLSVPTAATRISMRVTGRALEKQGAGVRAALHLHHRAIAHNVDLERWSAAHVLGDVVRIPAASERYQVGSVDLLLEALQLRPGTLYQVQLVRDPSDSLDTLKGVYSLVELAIAFS
jgi:hypothetical protein